MTDLVQQQMRELVQLMQEKEYSEHTVSEVRKAFEFANKMHGEQQRKSGEPFIIHPITTVKTLVLWLMDEKTLVAGMLHDVIEDTTCTEEELKNEFGQEVCKLVMFVTKVSIYARNQRNTINKDKTLEAYSIKVFMSMTEDIRAMIIKLADRYHNMLTIEYLREEKRRRVAKETLEIYANIAGRLGMYKVKTDLLDMSFAVLDPENYYKVKNTLDEIISLNKIKWDEATSRLAKILEANNVVATLESRIKGIYSTYKKMTQGYEIKNIHDIYALRLIVDDIHQCYHSLGLIHMNFTYIINTFKDYISNPKWNLYQSIHTTISFENTLFEIQIRTEKMNTFANYGLAAHWKYKENNPEMISNTIDKTLLMRDFIHNEIKDVKQVKNITTATIYDVLIMNSNEWITITNTHTLLDLAYRYDQKNFFKVMAVYLNGERAHFDAHVESGDTIKIVYSQTSELVNQSWLRSANNEVVKKYIKAKLADLEGHKLANKEQFMRDANFYLDDKIITLQQASERIRNEFNINDFTTFIDLTRIAEISDNVKYNVFSDNKQTSKKAINIIKSKIWKWLIANSYFDGLENLYFNELIVTTCCSKVPGFDCVAKLIRNKVEIHRSDCKKVKNTRAKTLVVDWSQEKLKQRPRYFLCQIELKGNWSESIGNIIAQILIRHRANLSTIIINKHKINKTHNTKLIIYVKNSNHLQVIIDEFRIKNIMYEWKLI
ncbi:RelA/SpoT family protein [Ureaplasma zalophigenitalium]|uniref:RelA/SpoT family protein n=1 Tax=Ureaplasma zalophigenitalium TaxID=907723 RepID=A0ABT3BPI2_9BACT|nr:RelA/SpoT family protein [Ureaplasma zalophigenitalium]MCV3753918.1 RelA/SpoT family protein [Ureaplasma zalophigenitalium]